MTRHELISLADEAASALKGVLWHEADERTKTLSRVIEKFIDAANRDIALRETPPQDSRGQLLGTIVYRWNEDGSLTERYEKADVRAPLQGEGTPALEATRKAIEENDRLDAKRHQGPMV